MVLKKIEIPCQIKIADSLHRENEFTVNKQITKIFILIRFLATELPVC
jgi:hypothetical protein